MIKIIRNYIELPLFLKILIGIILSTFVHICFKYLIYFGLYNYCKIYKIPLLSYENLDISLLYPAFYFKLLCSTIIISIITSFYYFILFDISIIKNQNKYSFAKYFMKFLLVTVGYVINKFYIKRKFTTIRSLINFIDISFLGEKKLDFYIKLILSILTSMIIISLSISYHYLMYFLLYFLLPILFALLLNYLFKEFNKAILPIIISFAFFTSSFDILNISSIEKNLQNIGIGGNIPITIVFNDNKNINGLLLLLNSDYIVLQNNNTISVYKYKDIKLIIKSI